MERDGFASGLTLVIHASRRRTSDLSILPLILGMPFEWNLSSNHISRWMESSCFTEQGFHELNVCMRRITYSHRQRINTELQELLRRQGRWRWDTRREFLESRTRRSALTRMPRRQGVLHEELYSRACPNRI